MTTSQLLHTGKALKAAQGNEPQDLEAIRGRLSTRMAETIEKYDRAVDDIEHEVVRLSPLWTPVYQALALVS